MCETLNFRILKEISQQHKNFKYIRILGFSMFDNFSKKNLGSPTQAIYSITKEIGSKSNFIRKKIYILSTSIINPTSEFWDIIGKVLPLYYFSKLFKYLKMALLSPLQIISVASIYHAFWTFTILNACFWKIPVCQCS